MVNKEGKTVSSSTPPLQFCRLMSGRGLSHVFYLAELDYVLTVAFDNKLRIYDNDTKRVVACLENPHECPFTDVTYDRTHHQVFLVDKYGFLFVYDIQKEKSILIHRILTEPLLSITFIRHSDEIAIALKGRVTWWKIVRDTSYQAVSEGHSGPVICVQFSAQSRKDASGSDPLKYVYSASLDNTVRMWDAYDMVCLRTLEEHRSDLASMRFCEAHNVLVTGHDDGTVRLWNLDTSSTINMRKHENTVSCILTAVLKRGEEFVLTGGFDGRVGIWDVRKKSNARPHLVTMFEAHANSEVLCILHDPHKNTIVTAGNDTVIKVWSAGTYELVGQHTGHTEAVMCLTLDANFLFSGSEDTTIRVWDALSKATVSGPAGHRRKKTVIKTLVGHTRPVTGLDMLEETGHLLSCSLDGTLKVWNYTMGACLLQFEHAMEFRCLAYRADHNEALVGTSDDSILVFKLPDESRQVSRATSATQPAPLWDLAAQLAMIAEQDGKQGKRRSIKREASRKLPTLRELEQQLSNKGAVKDDPNIPKYIPNAFARA
uniref:Uncharacterized protein n=1 Tax=Pyramimonas obovata TaxID=1411642 RepID=A0A7S0MZX6_9CHLO